MSQFGKSTIVILTAGIILTAHSATAHGTSELPYMNPKLAPERVVHYYGQEPSVPLEPIGSASGN